MRFLLSGKAFLSWVYLICLAFVFCVFAGCFTLSTFFSTVCSRSMQIQLVRPASVVAALTIALAFNLHVSLTPLQPGWTHSSDQRKQCIGAYSFLHFTWGWRSYSRYTAHLCLLHQLKSLIAPPAFVKNLLGFEFPWLGHLSSKVCPRWDVLIAECQIFLFFSSSFFKAKHMPFNFQTSALICTLVAWAFTN